MDKQNKKQKLQFLVPDFKFNIFEQIRKNRFNSTTKQYLLEKIFTAWLNNLSQNGRII
jgi:hypothetical protein